MFRPYSRHQHVQNVILRIYGHNVGRGVLEPTFNRPVRATLANLKTFSPLRKGGPGGIEPAQNPPPRVPTPENSHRASRPDCAWIRGLFWRGSRPHNAPARTPKARRRLRRNRPASLSASTTDAAPGERRVRLDGQVVNAHVRDAHPAPARANLPPRPVPLTAVIRSAEVSKTCFQNHLNRL